MRIIRYAILAAIAVVLITVALANRQFVTLRLLPEEISALVGVTWDISLPMFVIVLVSVAVGVLLGFVWEWIREHKHRAEAARQRKEKERLQKEMQKSGRHNTRGEDDVLAILDESSPARRSA